MAELPDRGVWQKKKKRFTGTDRQSEVQAVPKIKTEIHSNQAEVHIHQGKVQTGRQGQLKTQN